jgi:hypothetical protein
MKFTESNNDLHRCMHQCHSRHGRFFLAILTTGNRFEAMSALVACGVCRDFVEAKGSRWEYLGTANI